MKSLFAAALATAVALPVLAQPAQAQAESAAQPGAITTPVKDQNVRKFAVAVLAIEQYARMILSAKNSGRTG